MSGEAGSAEASERGICASVSILVRPTGIMDVLGTLRETAKEKKKRGTVSSAAPPAGRMLDNGTMAEQRRCGYSVHSLPPIRTEKRWEARVREWSCIRDSSDKPKRDPLANRDQGSLGEHRNTAPSRVHRP